ncbi:hypothetical protein ACFQ3N_08785 [Virgibacillus byunsanensis]|uniref:Endolytic transglycosylase MltG n=1 Tax=Virgibacillus byunsanensis TaxID=570945 RepID=A0ABW3LJE8_9BACI
MKQPIRSFSLGLLTAGVLFLIVIYFSGDSTTAIEETSIEDLIVAVEDDGYHVLTQQEYISKSVGEEKEETEETTEEAENTNQSDENNSSEEENDTQEDTTSTYTLSIDPGVTPSEISDILFDNQIIDNASDFTQYLENEDYSLKVQIGEYELSSEMSHYDIAEEITN